MAGNTDFTCAMKRAEQRCLDVARTEMIWGFEENSLMYRRMADEMIAGIWFVMRIRILDGDMEEMAVLQPQFLPWPQDVRVRSDDLPVEPVQPPPVHPSQPPERVSSPDRVVRRHTGLYGPWSSWRGWAGGVRRERRGDGGVGLRRVRAAAAGQLECEDHASEDRCRQDTEPQSA